MNYINKENEGIEILDLDETIEEAKEFTKGYSLSIPTFIDMLNKGNNDLINYYSLYQLGFMLGYMHANDEI